MKGKIKLNQEEFIKKLKDKLEILTPEALEEEIKIYELEIERQKDQNIKEEAIIKSFGTIENIVKKILNKHGINPEKVMKKESLLYKKFEELFEVIHRVVDVMSKNELKENIKIVFDLLILIIFISLIKIPFILIQNLGDSLLSYIDIPYSMDIWGLIVDLIYIVISVIIFANIFTKWFKNLKVAKKIKTKELESVTLKDNEKE